jgi:hypothetical protein
VKFTPSATWTLLQNGASKSIRWKPYARRTTTLATALNSGTWTDLSGYVDEVPDVSTNIEYEVGQFTADSISFTGRNIAWWKANVFTAPTNLVANGTFESNANNWTTVGGTTFTRNTTNPISGTGDGKCVTTNSSDGIYSDAMSFTSGVTYNINFKFRKTAAGVVKWKLGTTASIASTALVGTPTTHISLTATSNTSISYQFTAGETSNGYFIFYQGTATATEFYIDSVTIEALTYTEVKVEAKIGWSESSQASDTAYMFNGFIHDSDVRYNELADSVEFTVYSVEDIMDRIPGHTVNTQYINYDCDGGGTDGVILPKIPGYYITNCNVTSYPLEAGLHTLTYTASGSYLALDDGPATAISSGANTLVDGSGSQKVAIYYLTGYGTRTTDCTEYFIVNVRGDTLPRSAYNGVALSRMLRNFYSKVGVTSITLDTLAISSWDGNRRLSFYDVVPEDVSVSGNRYAICHDGTDVWVGVGNKLYKRTMSTDTYTLKATLTAGFEIRKLIYNSRNSHIWIMSDSAGYGDTHGFNKVNVYRVTNDDVSSTVTANTKGSIRAAKVIDYNYTGASYKYALLYIDEGGTRFDEVTISGTTLTLANVYTNVNPPMKWALWVKTTGYVYFMQDFTTTGQLHEHHIDGAGAWVDDGAYGGGSAHASLRAASTEDWIGEWNSSEDLLYFYNASNIYKWDPTTRTVAPATITSGTGIDAVECMVDSGSGTVYCSVFDSSASDVFRLTGLYSSSLNFLTTNYEVQSYMGQFTIEPASDDLYGITTPKWQLFKWSSTINLFLDEFDYANDSIRTALNKIYKAFNLVGSTSAAKTAFVYRRGDGSGTPQTTGNSITVNVTNSGDISQTPNSYKGIDLIEVSNSSETITYNGNVFNQYSQPFDARKITVSSDLIPTEIIKDLAKWMFDFFHQVRTMYEIPLTIPAYNYEPLDGITLAYSTTKITSTSSGVIYGVTYSNDGTMKIEALI